MRNFKRFAAIILGVAGISAFTSSCGKEKTCKCDLEDSPGVDIEITIKKGKCEDVKGEFEYLGYTYDIDSCS